MAKTKTPAGGAKAAETTPETKPAESSETQTAATAPPETKEEKPAPTPEELQAQVDAIFAPTSSAVNAKIQDEREKEPEPPKPEAAEEDLPQTDAPEGGEKVEGSEEPAPEPEPEKPAATSPAERFVPGMTPEQVQATAREAAREVIESREPEPAPEVPHGTTPVDEEGLSDDAREHLLVVKKMAAMNPAFRDLPAKKKEFWKKEEKYIDQWVQANPGVAFNEDSPEHAEFYRKNEPFTPKQHFEAAKKRILIDEAKAEIIEEVRKEHEPKFRKMELERHEEQAAPAIKKLEDEAEEEIFGAVPQFKETFKTGRLTQSERDRFDEINPVISSVAKEEFDRARVKLTELERMRRGLSVANPQMMVPLKNGQFIAPHQELEHDSMEAEANLLQKKERNGKKLISITERDRAAYHRLVRVPNIQNMNPDQQLALYHREIRELSKTADWLQLSDTRDHIIAKSKARVGQFAQSFAKMTQPAPKTTAPNGQPANGAPPANGKPAATPAKPSGKSGLARGTSTSSSSDTSDNAPKGQSELQKTTEYLAKMAFP